MKYLICVFYDDRVLQLRKVNRTGLPKLLKRKTYVFCPPPFQTCSGEDEVFIGEKTV